MFDRLPFPALRRGLRFTGLCILAGLGLAAFGLLGIEVEKP